MGDSGTSTSSSAYSRGARSPSVGSDSPEAEGPLFTGAETPSAQLEEMEKKEDMSPEQATIRVIQQHLQGRDEVSQELIENLPMESEPSSILSSSMATVCNLRLCTKPIQRALDTMLGGLLTETPTTDKLQHLLESCSDFPKVGNFVLQLGLHISDPANDISRQARGGIYWLYRLLLQKWELNIREASELWCRDRLQDTECLGYWNMARVWEVFGEIFMEGQRRTFLQAALLAIHDPQLCVSQAGLVLSIPSWGKTAS
ncbi:unnamed protein product [Caretta caretta]